MTQPTIDLYTSGTPNGQKASILLHELDLPYNLHNISLSANDQKKPDFLQVNPNGRIPAIVDKTDGQERRLFESGALMLYLCERYDKEHELSFEHGSDEYWEMICWVFWQNAGVGPMQGQANHFYRYAPEKIQYGINRYQTETRRLYQVLEDRLAQQESAGHGLWLVGKKYTIADLCTFCWVNWAEWCGVYDFVPQGPTGGDGGKFKHVKRWLDAINAKPGVKAGLDVPTKFEMKEAMRTKEGEEEYAKMHSNWVMQGQNEEQSKQQ